MKRTLAIVILVLCAGCGRSALEQAKIVGLAAKQTAESAYLTIRVEYLLGHVDEATMEQARSHYARFRLAQSAYVEALKVWEAGGEPADLEALKRRVGAIAAGLHAIQADVLNGNRAANGDHRKPTRGPRPPKKGIRHVARH